MPQPLRVFISSPGDVVEERRRAALVIRRLKREFARFFDLSAVLWEYEPMLASGHFQDIIERPSSTDVVVLILWSRLGTSLPADRYRGFDGRTPVTGAEWEFEEALTARKSAGTPDILVYRKTADAVVRFSHGEQFEEARAQWQTLQTFWERHFAADGVFKLAFNCFETLDGFEAVLEEHLRALLRRRLPEPAVSGGPRAITWHDGSPFRGLEAFEPRHAAIFFGRERAEREVTEALVRAAEAGCAFLLITGASGSGKSSLIKAGVLPNLTAPGVVAGVESWRHVLFRPGQAAADPAGGLAHALIEQPSALPELPAAGVAAEVLAEHFRRAPDQVALPLGVGLAHAASAGGVRQGRAVRLVVVIDQLEELFTLSKASAEARADFVRLLGALARSGSVWVVATLRSDHLYWLTDVPELRDLAAGEQLYHLLPPRPAELDLLIRRPAEAAGIAFETGGEDGTGLDAVLAEAAGRDAGTLPLLSFALDELYRRDIAEGRGNLMSFASYRALGGLEGAIAGRAEEVAEELIRPSPVAMERALDAVLRSLVTVTEDGTATARLTPCDEAAPTPERAAAVDRLVAARLVVATGDAAGAWVRLAHEALLSYWPRLKDLVTADGEFLRIRTRLLADRTHWEMDGRPDDLLLPAGKRLAEAEDLLATRRDELDSATAAYIGNSIARAQLLRDRQLRRTRLVAIGMGALAVLAGAGGWFAWDRSVEAERQRVIADEQRSVAEANAEEARKQTAAATQSKKIAEENLAEADRVLTEAIAAYWVGFLEKQVQKWGNDSSKNLNRILNGIFLKIDKKIIAIDTMGRYFSLAGVQNRCASDAMKKSIECHFHFDNMFLSSVMWRIPFANPKFFLQMTALDYNTILFWGENDRTFLSTLLGVLLSDKKPRIFSQYSDLQEGMRDGIKDIFIFNRAILNMSVKDMTAITKNDRFWNQHSLDVRNKEGEISKVEVGEIWKNLGYFSHYINSKIRYLKEQEKENNINDGEKFYDILSNSLVNFGKFCALYLQIETDPGVENKSKIIRRACAEDLREISSFMYDNNKIREAISALRAKIIMDELMARTQPKASLWQEEVAKSLSRIGEIYDSQNDYAAALSEYEKVLALRPDNTYALHQAAVASHHLGRFPDAVLYAERRVAVRRTAGDDANRLAGALGSMSFFALLAGDYSKAKVAANEGYALAPSELWVLTNAAHAEMFLGNTEASLELHRRYRAAKVNDAQTWVEAVRDDFTEFRKAGLSNPAMAEIERLLDTR